MNVNINSNDIKNNLPAVYDSLVEQMLQKINKHKKKDILSKNPDNWQWSFNWAQKIQAFSFQDIMNGQIAEPIKHNCVEEKVFDLFKKGDLLMHIEVKNTTLKVMTNFYRFCLLCSK